MKKIVLIILISLFSSELVISQDKKVDTNYKPKKNSLTVSLLLGRGAYLDSGSGRNIGTNTVNGNAPFYRALDNNNNSLANMVGLEGKYFISSKMAVSLTGGVTYRNTPEQINIPGVVSTDGDVLVPAYSAVIGEDDIDVHIAPGVQWYFELKRPRLLPYVGVSLPLDYSRSSVFDPTIDPDRVNYGIRHVELFGVGVQGIAGLDYYLTNDLFIGFDVKPVTFNYLVNNKKPRPGALGRKAENYTFSFFSQYVFKIGFRLN